MFDVDIDTLEARRARLRVERQTPIQRMQAAIDPARRSNRPLNPDEQRAYDAARDEVEAVDREIDQIDVAIAEAREDQSRSARVDAARSGVSRVNAAGGYENQWRHTGGGETYRRGDQSVSFVKDLALSSCRNDRDAYDRLQRNTKEVGIEYRALSTTDGAGGDFVPPLWAIAEYAALARPARPTADAVRGMVLPKGTDSLNIPKIATGTAVAEQSTQNTAVQNTDATTAAVSAAVATLAGQQVVSVQAIEQSPINLDEILLEDLTLDLAAKTDLFVLNNNAANKRGLLNTTGTNAVTFTNASPTPGLLYPKLADAMQQIYTNRFLAPDTIVMHPRRWAWFLAALDSQNRPLVLPGAGGSLNALGVTGAPTSQGIAGSLLGMQVILDPNVPTNLGAGTNQDPIIMLRSRDAYLWEGSLNVEAFRDTKADQLSVVLVSYSYIDLTAERYAKAVSVINGTRLVAPTF